MKLSAILAPLIAAKVSHEIIMQTVQAWESENENAVDASKEKARERWRKWKANKNANVGKRLSTTTNNSCEGVTRGEDNLQDKVITGQEEKKVASPSARPSRGSRIPDDFQPDIESAVAEGVPRIEAERQARSFCDYWRSKPGKDGLKLDWPATWRVWYRRSIPSHSPSRQSTAPPNSMERMNRLLDEMQGKTSEQPPTYEASYDSRDSGSPTGIIQFDAFAARR